MLGTAPDLHREEVEGDGVSKQRTPAWLTEDGNIFSVDKVVTLDPGSVMGAWDRLAQDTCALEFQSLPHIMHYALLRTLMERGWSRK